MKQVEELRAAHWLVPWVSPELERFHAKQRPPDLEFYERSADFGPDDRWLSLLKDAKKTVSIMGVALQGWVKTKNFEQTLIARASEGCDVRILTLHDQNPAIDMLNITQRVDASAATVRGQIQLSSAYFRRLAESHRNIAFRQIQDRTPNFALTITDQTALLVQYWHSLNWRLGPHLQCRPRSAFYEILMHEFDVLWDQAIPPDVVQI